MPVIIQLVEGNRSPTYAFTLERNGVVIDLTNVTSVVMNIINAKTLDVTASGVSCSITAPTTSGVVAYSPLTAHFPSGGRYLGEVKITHSGGLIEVLNEYVNFVVRDALV